MLLIITIALCIAAIVLSFFSAPAALATLALLTLAFALMLFALKRKKYEYIPTLSAGANELVRKYGHFYHRPHAGASCSGSCSFITLATILVTIICCIKGAWWSIPCGIFVYIAAAYTARGFNPMSFLSPAEQAFHDEVASKLNTGR